MTTPTIDRTGKFFTPTAHHDTYAAIDPAQWDLAGKVVLITGASRGIGAATAVAFARAGAAGIVITARASDGALVGVEEAVLGAAAASSSSSATKPTVLRLALDVTDEASAAAAARAVRGAFGRLDVLVNNAGAMEAFRAVADADAAAWWATWAVNVQGPFVVTRALLPLLLESVDGAKTVVNVSSRGAHLLFPGCSGYQTSKFALLRFTEFIEVEYGEQGVLPIAMHPGSVPTELAFTMPQDRHAALIDTPALAGDTIVWLCAERREWLAGRYVSCTWDMRELEDKKEEIVAGDKLKMRMVV